jgi:hypothetical protein
MIPFCFKQNADGDVDISFKFTTTLVEFVAIRLSENMSFFLGEWFLDQRQGMPYWRYILGQRYDAGIADRVFRKGAELTAGVARVSALQTRFDRKTRALSVPVLKVVLTDGSTITQDQLRSPFILDLQNVSIPVSADGS